MEEESLGTKDRRYVVKMVVYAKNISEAAVKARFSEVIDISLADEHIETGVVKVGFDNDRR